MSDECEVQGGVGMRRMIGLLREPVEMPQAYGIPQHEGRYLPRIEVGGSEYRDWRKLGPPAKVTA